MRHSKEDWYTGIAISTLNVIENYILIDYSGIISSVSSHVSLEGDENVSDINVTCMLY